MGMSLVGRSFTLDEYHRMAEAGILDSVVLAEDPSLRHAVVFVQCETASDERHAHTIGPPRRQEQVPGMSDDWDEAERGRHRNYAGRSELTRHASPRVALPRVAPRA